MFRPCTAVEASRLRHTGVEVAAFRALTAAHWVAAVRLRKATWAATVNPWELIATLAQEFPNREAS